MTGDEQKIDKLKDFVGSLVPVRSEETALTKREEDSYDKAAKEIKLASDRQDMEERKRYAGKIFGLVAVWLVFIAIVMISVGLSFLKFSENVVLALIGSTTLNVLVLFYIVANYLFPKK